MSSYDNSLPSTLHDWLQRVGFNDNPFAQDDAHAESKCLPAYFRDVGIFDMLAGNPLVPEPRIIFAPRGGGKSAYWVMLQNKCQPSQEREAGVLYNVLAVPHIRFTRLLELRRTRHLTARDHLNEILRYGTRNLLEALTNDCALARNFPRSACGRLRWFCDEFYPELLQPESVKVALEKIGGTFPFEWEAFEQAVERRELTSLMRSLSAPESLGWLAGVIDAHTRPLSPMATADELMTEFCSVARASGLAAVYILVDELDATAEAQQNLSLVVELVEPLLEDQALMTGNRWAFRVFLPEEARDMLLKPGTRLAQFIQRHQVRIQWNEEALRGLLSERLKYYSNEKIESLEQIGQRESARASVQTEPEQAERQRPHQAKRPKTIEEDLILKAAGSPRRALQLGRYLLEAHVARTQSEDLIPWGQPVPDEQKRMQDVQRAQSQDLIKWEDWRLALARFAEDSNLGTPEAEMEGILTLRLHLDKRRISKGPWEIALTEKESAFLKSLAEHDGLCDRDILVKEVWGDGAEYDPQLVGQLVQRIRKKIETPGSPPVYLTTERDRGYRLSHYQK